MKFIKDTFKQLKREYGLPVVLYNVISVALNLDTGAKRQTIQFKNITRAVVLPAKQYQKENYNPNDRDLYLDYIDFEIKVGTRVIYSDQYFEAIEVDVFEGVYILRLRAIEGAEVFDYGTVTDTLVLTEVITYE